MIDAGTGMALLGASSVVTAAIIKFAPSNGSNRFMRRDLCNERHGEILRRLEGIENGVSDIVKGLNK